MNCLGISSDQLFTWSATNDNKVHPVRLEEASPCPPAQTPLAGSHSPRLSHRTLQALWQARLQMRQGSRSWSQVLPVCKLPPFAPPNGLRTAGVSRPDQKVSCQLSARSRDLGGDLPDQSRTVAPSRGTLSNHDERNIFLAHRTHRFDSGRRAPCQYARDLARRPSGLLDINRGGDR
jgi:hypothetical protein